jgi:arylformamidase
MISLENYQIIDISQPVTSQSACFPGDVPFSRSITVSYQDSKVVNLTSLTMSPHVGTHADAPSHIGGSMDNGATMAGAMDLNAFLGPATVVDVAPCSGVVDLTLLKAQLENIKPFPERLLVRTQTTIRHGVFEKQYAYFAVDLIDYLGAKGVKLLGIDTPSVDHTDSKQLETHHALDKHHMSWLENLDLTKTTAGSYFLVALPLKLMELEASPVRAVLLKPQAAT